MGLVHLIKWTLWFKTLITITLQLIWLSRETRSSLLNKGRKKLPPYKLLNKMPQSQKLHRFKKLQFKLNNKRDKQCQKHKILKTKSKMLKSNLKWLLALVLLKKKKKNWLRLKSTLAKLLIIMQMKKWRRLKRQRLWKLQLKWNKKSKLKKLRLQLIKLTHN